MCLAQNLVQMLINFSPTTTKIETNSTLLNEPKINPHAVGVVASQAQVDDLLDSLGF